MPFHLGPMELGIILVIILLVFGAGKLPLIGGQIGRGIKSFRKEVHELADDLEMSEEKDDD